MNCLFERIRLQAAFSRLYQHLDWQSADQIIADAWQIERAKTPETAEPLDPEHTKTKLSDAIRV